MTTEILAATRPRPTGVPHPSLFRSPESAAAHEHESISATGRTPRRGDIWFISTRSQDPDLGSHRSVGTEIWSNKFGIVVSNDQLNDRSGFVQIVYLTASPRRRPNRLHVQVDLAEPMLMPRPRKGRDHDNTSLAEEATSAIALCEQIHAVDASRLHEFHGTVNAKQLDQIGEAMLWSLGLHSRAAVSSLRC